MSLFGSHKSWLNISFIWNNTFTCRCRTRSIAILIIVIFQ